MKKTIAFCVLIFTYITTYAQNFNNEWIDYNKTYYKFKVGQNGLYRINQSQLINVGLGNVNAEYFQLWRNGEQVTIFTSKAVGLFSNNDYIEFWGIINDGKMDRVLYANPNHQLSTELNLLTDSSTYFLTVNTNVSQNLRYSFEANNVSSNTLPAENSFIYTQRINYKNQSNRGYALNTSGESIFSSSYDEGEFLSTNDISLTSPFNINLNNLFIDNSSNRLAQIRVGFAGNAPKIRNIKISLNALEIQNKRNVNYQSEIGTFSNLSLTNFTGTNDNVKVELITTDNFDRIVLSFFEMQYPRLFNFNNQTNFEFSLQPNSNGQFLQINNFNYNNSTPVLYDISNNRYYIANITINNILQFAIPPTTTTTNYVLVSQANSNINSVNINSGKRFIDYSNVNLQSNYLIITNKLLTDNGTAVEEFRQYRTSVNGGNYNAKIYDIDELTDQFAFGVNKHPLSVKNFIRFANTNFANKPSYVFLIGKAYTYDQVRSIQSKSISYQDSALKQDLVPTFGWPASDALLVSNNTQPIPLLAFGRLAAINNEEVAIYLQKLKEYEEQQKNTTQTIANKAWQKQLMHVVGAEDGLSVQLTNAVKFYESIARDSFFGAAPAITLTKTTGGAIDVTSNDIARFFENGISHITYFGHSAAGSLSYNLNNPEDYNNKNKYPNFLALGCSAGNFFDYDPLRFNKPSSLAERFVFIKDKGSISFLASTHFGFVGQLDIYAKGFYYSFAKNNYGNTLGKNMLDALNYYRNNVNISDFINKIHAEQFVLHGDPAIKIYHSNKPDFVIEDPQVVINPTFISILNNSFSLKANIYNIGKAVGDSVRLLVKRTYPNGTSVDLINKNIPSIYFIDSTSINLTIPINAATDKGNNSISIIIDANNKYDELSETNNSITKNFIIFEDEVKPIFPPNYAIINKQNIKLVASTANVFVPQQQYIIEFDTTTLFNSNFKTSKQISSTGGLLEFEINKTFVDSTVYYWRISLVPSSGNEYRWINSSFVYLQNAQTSGFNQSHFFQHCESILNNLKADSLNRKLDFVTKNNTLTINNSVFPFNERTSISINDAINVRTYGACFRNHNLTFTVYNASSLTEMFNSNVGQPGQYGSQFYNSDCVPGREYDFAFDVTNATGRKAAMDFMDNIIPTGSYVVVRNINLMYRDGNGNLSIGVAPTYASDWLADESIFGAGNTLYHRLKNAGFTDIDSFNRIRSFAFVYQKNNNNYIPTSKFSIDSSDVVTLKVFAPTKPQNGYILSPKFGVATKWFKMLWNGKRTDLEDIASLKLLGIKSNNVVDTIRTFTEVEVDNDISNINASTYPYLQIFIQVKDSVNLSAYQLKHWRLLGSILPEGALMPINFVFKDTLQKGEIQNVNVVFKNISTSQYEDSLTVDIKVLDNNNISTNIAFRKLKALKYNETDTLQASINSATLVGKNTFSINVNPINNPQEVTLTNNIAFKNFFVNDDNLNPILDVTFDGIHILNNDIVSSKPNIRIALKDEARYMLLNDTSTISVRLKYPDGSIRRYRYDNDTLKFVPATNDGKNTAIAEFFPNLTEDGEYELYVIAKDRSENNAGPQQYRVVFNINNKPMISDVFNYPNPFTTSTAFVFTLTGSQVPQNIRIQILTVTGKIVKEITKQELGNLHIGRNITEYKWDGTDMYGQALGNGVYLYRVITNNNGQALDKYMNKDNFGSEINTDKFFKQGYGKMYLMR